MPATLSRPKTKTIKKIKKAPGAAAASNARPAGKGKNVKRVYFFGAGKAEGGADMKDLLGGKGANLADMTKVPLPVPPGFTISTAACNLFVERRGSLTPEIDAEIERALVRL